MDRNDIAWTGYIPAITTPFTREGNLDWPALAQQLEWYVQERMHGVILAGTSGEWFSLNEAERAQLFAESGRNIGGRITVLGGCNAYTAAEAIRHARAAQRAGWTASSSPRPLHRAQPQGTGSVLPGRLRRDGHPHLRLQLAARLRGGHGRGAAGGTVRHRPCRRHQEFHAGLRHVPARRISAAPRSATSTCPPRRWAPIWRRWASATA